MIMKGIVRGSKGGEWTSELCTYFFEENCEIEVNRYSLQKCVQDLHWITTSEEIKKLIVIDALFSETERRTRSPIISF